jgi:hypothetical protein
VKLTLAEILFGCCSVETSLTEEDVDDDITQPSPLNLWDYVELELDPDSTSR